MLRIDDGFEVCAVVHVWPVVGPTRTIDEGLGRGSCAKRSVTVAATTEEELQWTDGRLVDDRLQSRSWKQHGGDDSGVGR